jgi:hypothetical protein
LVVEIIESGGGGRRIGKELVTPPVQKQLSIPRRYPQPAGQRYRVLIIQHLWRQKKDRGDCFANDTCFSAAVRLATWSTVFVIDAALQSPDVDLSQGRVMPAGVRSWSRGIKNREILLFSIHMQHDECLRKQLSKE